MHKEVPIGLRGIPTYIQQVITVPLIPIHPSFTLGDRTALIELRFSEILFILSREPRMLQQNASIFVSSWMLQVLGHYCRHRWVSAEIPTSSAGGFSLIAGGGREA